MCTERAVLYRGFSRGGVCSAVLVVALLWQPAAAAAAATVSFQVRTCTRNVSLCKAAVIDIENRVCTIQCFALRDVAQ
jgi:hypothetical protein